MNNSLTFGKRALTMFVVATTILWTLGVAAFAAPTASAVSTGSLVKSASLSVVYYYGTDGQRYVFPNLKTYETWYTNFSGVLTVSDSEIAAMPIGGNVVYRPGSRFVKIQSNFKTYAVTPNGVLRWIETPAVAEGLAGSAWNTMIDDVPDLFFSDYTIGSSLMTAAAYNGMYVTSGGSDYVVLDGAKRVLTAAGKTANGVQARFFVTPGSDLLGSLTAGADITSANANLNDPAQLGASVVTPVAGGLSVSLASDTPASSTVPSQASNVAFMKFNLTANGGNATITSIAVKMAGLGAVSNISTLYLYEGANRLTNSRSVNSTTRVATFGGMNLAVQSGQTRAITVVGQLANLSSSGDTIQFQVESIASIQSNATVSGSFPVSGNTMTTSSTDVGTLTIEKGGGTISNPTLGAIARVAEFKLTAGSTEGVSVKSLRLDIRSAEKHSVYELRQNGVKLSDGVQSGDYVMFTLTTPFEIAQGNNRTFEVWTKVGGDSTDTIKVRMEELTDLVATGLKYGFGVGVTNSYSTAPGSCTASTTAGCNYSLVQGGKLTFAFNGPTTGDIGLSVTSVLFWEGTITAKNYTEIRDIDFAIVGNNLDGTATTDANYQNWRLINKATGATLMGPLEFTSGFSNTAATLDFSDDFTMSVGQTLDVQLLGDVKSGTAPYTVANTNTIYASLDVSGLSARDGNNDDLAATDFVPATSGSDLTGNTMTVRTSSLTINAASSPASQTVVKGTNNVDMVGFSLQAGTASKATVSAITFHGTGEADGSITGVDGDLALQTYLGACSLYDGQTGSLIDGPESFDSSDDIVFSGFSWEIPASTSYKMLLRCNVANYTVVGANDFFAVEIKATQTDNVASVDKDGNDITETVSDTVASANRIHAGDAAIGVTVANAGTLAIALDGDSPSSTILLSNSASVTTSKFKFTASNEAFVVDRLTVDNSTATPGVDTAISTVELHYKNQAGVDKIATGFLTAHAYTFNGLDFYVPKDNTAVVTIKVNTGDVTATNAASGDIVGLDLADDDSGNTQFRAVGLGSNSTLNDSNVTGDVAANDHEIRKTKPTISLASGSPSGAAIVDDIEALRFNITADSRGDVTINDLTFEFSSTDNSGTGWNECNSGDIEDDDITLFDADELSTNLASVVSRLISTGAACTSTTDLKYINIDFATPRTIAAGTTKTYLLKINVSNTTAPNAVNDDSMRIKIPSEDVMDAATTTDFDAIGWLDSNTNGTDPDADAGDTYGIDGEYIKNLPVNGGALIF